MALQQQLTIPDPDGFYQELIEAQRDLSEDQQQLMNAKLILILANQVGDRATLSQAIQLARGPAAGS
jgi:hypothetical protein